MIPRPIAGQILRSPARAYLIVLTLACAALAAPSPGRSDSIPRTPVIDGEWRCVSHSPKLPEIDSGPGEVVDHCFFKAANGKWQLWTQIRGAAIGRLFYRWEGGTKFEEQDWTPKGICWRADRESGESWQTGDQEFVHAPHVLVENGRFLLYYGGGPSSNAEHCQVNLATSKNGIDFTRFRDSSGASRIFIGPGWARDPMVLKVGGLYFNRFYISSLIPGYKGVRVARLRWDPSPGGPDAWQQRRRALAHRPRRLVFNNDGDDRNPGDGKPSIKAFLAKRTTPLESSQVDTIVYSTGGPFGMVKHRSNVFQVRANWMMDMGTDPLTEIVRWCREYEREIFWSMRMNDTHDSVFHVPGHPRYPFPGWPRLKEDHPEWLMGRDSRLPRKGAHTWSAVDYSVREVRDLAVALFDEVCTDYDVDGCEMDFFRIPLFFRAATRGEEATEENRRQMTEMIRRIRDALDRRGRARDRPILLSARVPDSLAYCRAIGLDLETWLREGLVDILVAGGDFRLQPWSHSVRLGRRYGVPVWACLTPAEHMARRVEPELYRNGIRVQRARAAAAWQAGVQAVYLFNHFGVRNPLFDELGDPALLSHLDKTYVANVMGKSGHHTPDTCLVGGGQYQELPRLHPDTWTRFAPGQERETVRLYSGDDPVAAAAQGRNPEVTLMLKATRNLSGERPGVYCNGVSAVPGEPSGEWLAYALPYQAVVPGWNRVDVHAARPSADCVCYGWDVEYDCGHRLKWPRQLPWRRLTHSREGCREIIEKDGRMIMQDSGTGQQDMSHLMYPWQVSPGHPVVVEASLRIREGTTPDPRGVCIRVADGRAVEFVNFYSDRVQFEQAALSYPLDTRTAFHTYCIVLQGEDIRLFVDGRPALDGSGLFTTPVSHPATRLDLNVRDAEPWNDCSLLVGSTSGPGRGTAWWDFIRFGSDTLALQDLQIRIDYPAQNDRAEKQKEGGTRK